jgi:hypothetical protein
MPPSNPRLTSLRVVELFAIANDDPNASKPRRVHGKRIEPISERERVEAVNELLREFRSQLEQLAEAKAPLASQGTVNEFVAATPEGAKPDTAKAVIISSEQPRRPERGKPVQVDPLLLQGIKDWGYRIFSKPDPVLAVEQLLGARARRGKRPKNGARDFRIAVAVVEEMRSGKTLETAAVAVAPIFHLEPERIQKIYKQHRLAARAEVALRALDKG